MTKHSVLLVEDDPATMKALRRFFSLRGWEVRPASTVAEGLDLLDPPPEYAILDMMLPDGMGDSVLERIRSAGLPTFVMICTGLHDPVRLGEARARGPDVLLLKPVGIDEIRRAFGMD